MKNSLFSILFTIYSIASLSQNTGKIILKGVFWDDSTGIDLKSTVHCTENGEIIKIVESGQEEKYNFVLPVNTNELVFKCKGYKDVKMPVHFIGSIASDFEAKFSITTLGKFYQSTDEAMLFFNLPNYYSPALKVEMFWIVDNQKRFMTDLTDLLKRINVSSFGISISNVKSEISIQISTAEGEIKLEKRFNLKKGLNFIDLNSKEGDLASQITIPTKTSSNEFGIRQLYFDQSSYDLKEQNKEVLDSLAIYLKENPNSKITIKGFTDGVGDKKMNATLAQFRTQVVAKYLFQKSIDENRINMQWEEDKEVHKDSLVQNRKVVLQVY